MMLIQRFDAGYTAVLTSLIGFTRSLAYAAAQYNIKANLLRHGWANTRLVDRKLLRMMTRKTAEAAKQFDQGQDIQKRVVEADELGAMAAMLASDAASAVTGRVIGVDRGFMV